MCSLLHGHFLGREAKEIGLDTNPCSMIRKTAVTKAEFVASRI